MNHTDWNDKPKKVDALMAETSPSYLESKEVDGVREAIEAIVEERGYVKLDN